MWAKRYKAVARKEKFDKVMLEKEMLPTGGRPIDGHADRAEYDRIVKSNDDGFTHLLLSVTSNRDVDTVAHSISLVLSIKNICSYAFFTGLNHFDDYTIGQ